MKRKILIILVFCLNVAIGAKAQLNTYPGYVNYRAYAVTKAIPLSEERQQLLAKYFLGIDSMAIELINKKAKVRDLTRLYITANRGLQKLLSPTEFAAFMVTTPNNTRILTAISYKDKLGLTEADIKALMHAYNESISLPAQEIGTLKYWETNKLKDLLKPQQFIDFFATINNKYNHSQASLRWQYMLKEKITDKIDSNKFKQDYVNLSLKKQVALASIKGERTKQKTDSIDRALYLEKPFIFRKSELYRGRSIDKSLFATLIKNRQVIKLSPTQLDSLVNRAYNLAVIKDQYDKKYHGANYKATAYEHDGLAKILTDAQLDKWLIYRNKNIAKNNALCLWAEMEARNLTQDVDAKKTQEELTDYELKRITSALKYQIKKTTENAKLRKMAQYEKPLLLIKLQEAKDLTATNQALKRKMAW